MNCSVCGMRADDGEWIEVPLEAKPDVEMNVCELCCVDMAIALFNARNVKVSLQEGMIMMEVV